MPGDASRLALIDAEIMRCRERAVLVKGGEGVMLMGRSSRRRASDTARDTAWKAKLTKVGELFTQFSETQRGGTAKRLVDRVLNHLTDTIKGLLDLDADLGWDRIIGILMQSQKFFQSAADFQSFYDGEFSPFHFFDAIAVSMMITTVPATNKADWLDTYLTEIGRSLHSRRLTDAYYDRAISSGSSQLMRLIAGTLIGKGGGGEKGSYDWRKALEKTLEQIEQLNPPRDRFTLLIYNDVITNLSETISKMKSLPPNSLKKPGLWSKLHERLSERKTFFQMLLHVPVIGKLFEALYSGFEVVTTLEDWKSIKQEKREETIAALLQHVGGELSKLDASDYDTFLPSGGGAVMQRIALILQGLDTQDDDEKSLDNTPYPFER
jgi:hypothetical protein